jgi:muramoyltetrapeptide carboxypeptidase
MTYRREFLRAAAAGAVAASVPLRAAESTEPGRLRPPRLRTGDVVGLVAPASAAFLRSDVALAQEVVEALGLRPRLGPHLRDRYGYLAGRDADRAADLNAFFADPEVRGILALRGGWGSARVLPHVDYESVRRHPKVFMGYSDITALLLGLYARAGLVTFHGPVGESDWNPWSVDLVRRVLFDAEAVVMENPHEAAESLVQTEHRHWTITPGRARGRLLGGNLTVLAHLVGTPYLPGWDGAILFLEDINEDLYRVDRMLTHLALAGILKQIRGFVFGTCTDCDPGRGYGSLTLEEIFDDHVRPLGVPAWHGAMIGHIDRKLTVPLGVEAEIDAERGSIRLLEPAVV